MVFGFKKPIEAESFTDFVERVKKEKADFVHAEPRVGVEKGAHSWHAGNIGEHEFSIRFISKAKDGKKIIFDETYASEFASEKGIADADVRLRMGLRLFLTAEEKLESIRKEIPGIKTAIVNGKKEWEPDMYLKMKKDAEIIGVEPFE